MKVSKAVSETSVSGDSATFMASTTTKEIHKKAKNQLKGERNTLEWNILVLEPTSATSPDTAAHGVGPTKLPVVTSESDAELTIDATSAGTEPQSLFELRSKYWVMPVKAPSSVGIA